jgi:hypothetical protein
MRNSNQLAVEVYRFPISAEELAERSRTLRTLLLRGARRSVEQHQDRNPAVETPEETRTLHLDAVEK